MRFSLPTLLILAMGSVPLFAQEPPAPAPAESEPAISADSPESSATPPITKDFDLGTVVDDTWLTNEESSAYYGLLQKAIETPVEELRKQGQAFVQKRREQKHLPAFPDMLNNPAEWRGQPVTLTGHVLQTVEYDPAPNPYGIGTLYESSLFIEDSQGHPITVIFTEKPENLPIGGELIDGVQVSGYFFKVYWYPSSDKQTRKAPLILAKTVSVRPPFVPGPVLPPIVSWGVLVLTALFVVGVLWKIVSNDRRRKEAQRAKAISDGPPDLSRL